MDDEHMDIESITLPCKCEIRHEEYYQATRHFMFQLGFNDNEIIPSRYLNLLKEEAFCFKADKCMKKPPALVAASFIVNNLLKKLIDQNTFENY